MKRMIAGALLLMGLGAGTMFADDTWRDRQDIRHDEARIAHDRGSSGATYTAEIMPQRGMSAGSFGENTGM